MSSRSFRTMLSYDDLVEFAANLEAHLLENTVNKNFFLKYGFNEDEK